MRAPDTTWRCCARLAGLPPPCRLLPRPFLLSFLFLLLFLLLSLPPAAAWAAPPLRQDDRPRIAALVAPQSAPLARLRAELDAAGFALRTVTATRWPPTRAELEETTRKEGAIAGLAVVEVDGDGGSEIWLVDRVTGKTVVRKLAAEPLPPVEKAELVAICTVETLRATLMEVALSQSSRGEVPPPAAVRALVATKPSRFAVRITAAGGYTPRGIGATAQLGLAATALVRQRLRVGIDGLIPLTDATVTGPEGRAQIGLFLTGPFIELSLMEPAKPVTLTVGTGAWLTLLRMRGATEAPYFGRSVNVFTVAPHIDLGVRLRITREVALGGRVWGAFATPEGFVRFAGRDAATWGRPFLLAGLFVEMALD